MNKSVDIEALRYPIGKLKFPKEVSQAQIAKWIDEIASFPSNIKELINTLAEEQLYWRYRPGGWSVRQVVHHCADSHMNSFMRFKLSLTEDIPTIKPYFEDRWAELPDTTEAPVSDSIFLLEGLHSRWTVLLKLMSENDFKKELFHPEQKRKLTLTFMTGLYAWHCRHHTAHIKQALEYEGQFS